MSEGLAVAEAEIFVLAGGTVGLNYPVTVLRDERLSRVYAPVSDYRERAGPLYWTNADFS